MSVNKKFFTSVRWGKKAVFDCKNTNIFFPYLLSSKFYLPSQQEDLMQGQVLAPLKEKIISLGAQPYTKNPS